MRNFSCLLHVQFLYSIVIFQYSVHDFSKLKRPAQ